MIEFRRRAENLDLFGYDLFRHVRIAIHILRIAVMMNRKANGLSVGKLP